MKKANSLSVVLLAGTLITSIAYAARPYALEYGYFAPDGTLNGTIYYPCDGFPSSDGELVGEKRVIFKEECACTIDDCDPG